MEDDSGDQRLGFLVPMRLAGRAWFVIDQGVGQGACVLGHIEAVRVEGIEGIEGGRGLAGDAEGVEDVDRAEGLAGAAGNPGIFALGVDADHGAVGREQVGDDGSHALAGARRCHRQQMGRAVIAQELSGFAVAADQQAGIGAGEGGGFLVGGEAGRAVGFPFHVPEMLNEGIGEDTENEDQEEQQQEQAGNRSSDPPFLRNPIGRNGEHQRDQKDEEADLQQIAASPEGRHEDAGNSPYRITRSGAQHVLERGPG